MKKKNLLLVILTLCLILSACSKGNSNSELNSTQESDVNTLESKKILTTGIDQETFNLSPLYMAGSNMRVGNMVYENLVYYKDGRIAPGLAEKWEISQDGKELTFHLREGIKFHDGEACDAEAVKKNLLHKQTNPNYYTLKAITDFESIDVADATTLTLKYLHPNFAYLNDFCWNDVMTICSPKLLKEGDFQTVSGFIGTGPYKYGEFVSGQYTKFIRNENYWGEKPYYDEIVFKYIPDSESRIKALKTGEIDFIYGSALMTYDQYNQAIAIPGMEGKVAESDTRARDITLNASSPLLNDLEVRQAIAYSINKQEISDTLTNGIEKVAETPFTEDSLFSDIKLDTNYNFDLEKAKSLLDEAGWKLNTKTGIREKDGNELLLRLIMDENFDSLNKNLATLIQAQLKESGINLTIKGMETMEWFNDYMAGEFDLTFWPAQYNFANPHCWFIPMDTMTPQTPSLQGLSDSGEFFEAVKKTTQTMNEDELRKLFTYLYNYDLGNVIDIPLTYSKDMIVYNSDKISDYKFVTTPCFFDINYLTPKADN